MNDIQMNKVALRFAGIDAKTRAGASIAIQLSDEAREILWGDDGGGDLYVVGLNLLADVGPLRNRETYDRLLKFFPDWWRLDGNAAKIIAHKLETATDAGERQVLDKEIADVATWFAEDDQPFDIDRAQLTWDTLKEGALQWEVRDTNWLASNPVVWSSELPSSTYSYYSVKTVTNTTELLAAGDAVDRALKSRGLQESAVAGTVRIFTVAEVLKALVGPIAAIVIEKTPQGWEPGVVHVKGEGGTPQSLLRLAHLLASGYAAREQVNENRRKIAAATSGINVGHLLGSIVSEALGTATSAPNSERPVSALPVQDRPKAPHFTYIDTCTLLEAPEREATIHLIEDSETTVIIVAAVLDELERKKAGRADLVRDANAALRRIEQWLLDGKAEVEGLDVERSRPYADKEILESIARHLKQGATATLITADTALRLRARASNPKGQIVTIDSRALVNETDRRPAPVSPAAWTRRDKASRLPIRQTAPPLQLSGG
ncbi:hypothetical protein RAMLITH_13590 [Ramlibacter sp. RBP-2]|uniref:PIN domain-containing protein n=1 Tax=Ramlibacter lithotrophicus TaxID=2606681 RepID=A0A7X6DGQ6_9BURK|nr:PIN domain-containing protein [Ramlibacter lithotrophicus]NKE66857.1 hypothetical protein [Ramlibacter lithotrophicus]